MRVQCSNLGLWRSKKSKTRCHKRLIGVRKKFKSLPLVIVLGESIYLSGTECFSLSFSFFFFYKGLRMLLSRPNGFADDFVRSGGQKNVFLVVIILRFHLVRRQYNVDTGQVFFLQFYFLVGMHPRD